MKTKFIASPGIAIIKLIEEKTNESLVLTNKSQGRIVKGEIISMGLDTTGTAGETVKASNFGKEKDIVWFLHYFDEGGVDVGVVDGIKYLFVKWGDFRAKQL
jgi:co-chaperonin GroES (HSP10)